MRARDTVFWDPEVYHGPKMKTPKDAPDGQKDKSSRGKTPLSEEYDHRTLCFLALIYIVQRRCGAEPPPATWDDAWRRGQNTPLAGVYT